MPALTTLDGIDLIQLKALLKEVVMEYLGLLKRYKKDLPKDRVTVIKHSDRGETSYEQELAVEWEHLSLCFHSQIEELQKTTDVFTFAASNSELERLLIASPPPPPARRGFPLPEENPPSEAEVRKGNFHSRLIDPFLEHYISKAKSLKFNQAAFDATLETLKRALTSTTDQGVILCPITNLVIDGSKIKINENILIREIREKEIEQWLSESGWSHPPLTFSELTKLRTAIEIHFDKPRDYSEVFGRYFFTSSDFNPERKAIQSVLTPLQLTFERKLQPAFMQIEITNGFFERSLYYEWLDIHHFDCKLVKKELRSFRKILKGTFGKTLKPNIQLAVKKWDDAADRHNAEDALLDHWAALETLFIRDKNPEKQYRLVSRIVGFLGTNKKERAALFDVLKDSYNYRSCIVHGSPNELAKIRADRNEQAKMFRWTRVYLKKAILKFLADENIDIEALKIERRLAERGMGKF